jgi:hypothetical protein
MEEDDFDGGGVDGEDERQPNQFRACDSCGGSNFFNEASGDMVCIDCGTQSQDVRHLTHEDFEGAAGAGGTSRGGMIRRYNTVQKHNAFLPAHHAFNTDDFVTALQAVVVAHAREVPALTGAPPHLFTSTLHEVWKRFLGRWAAAGIPIVHIIRGRLVGNGEERYYARLYAEGQSPPPVPAASMLLLLGISAAACRLLHLPVHAGTVAGWCADGRLTWFNAYGRLSWELQATLKLGARFFMPPAAPSAQAVNRATLLVARCVGLHPLPPLNAPLCAFALAADVGLPESVHAPLMELAALDAHDRAHAAAYDPPHRRKGHGIADELTRLRSACASDDSGAYIAALVATCLLTLQGWEEWVDGHVHPFTVGEGGSGGLTQAQLAHLSESILQGGEVGVGRAPAGYPPGAYSGNVTVTVADSTLLAVLETRSQGLAVGGGVAALSGDTRKALKDVAQAQSTAGRAATSGSMLALLLGSQGASQARVGEASQAASLAGASAGGAEGEEEMEEAPVERGISLMLGPRAVQPGYATAWESLWPTSILNEVSDHHRALTEIAESMGGAGAGAGAGAGGGAVSGAAAATTAAVTLTALPRDGLAQLQPRAWHSSSVAAKAGAVRPELGSDRWRALIAFLAARANVGADDVAAQCDGLALLLQLHTPLPQKVVKALGTRKAKWQEEEDE